MIGEHEKKDSEGKRAQSAHATEADFGAQVYQSKLPVIVAFLADWSQPCRAMEPVLEELSAQWEGKLRVVKVNVDRSFDLSILYDIQSIPTVLCFVEGKVRFRIVGSATARAILEKIKSSVVLSDQE